MKVSVAEVRDAYNATGNIWKAGEMLGISGQRVSQIMRQHSIPSVSNPRLSDADKETIAHYYKTTSEDAFDLNELAKAIGRTKQFICRHAGKMGLTDLRRPHSKKNKEKQSATSKALWQKKPHPRGYLGKKHDADALEKISAASKNAWATSKAFGVGHMADETRSKRSAVMSAVAAKRPAHKNYTKGAGGRRADLNNQFFRSSWEANYARYLNLLMKMGVVEAWEFEPETFWFKSIKRGVRSYLPDFKVKYRSDPTPVFVEVKGWVVAKDRTKWKRMKKYYPHIKLEIVGAKEYRAIKDKWSSAIPQWENGRKKLETPDAMD